MKQILNILFICLVFVSCKKDIKPEELHLLNGYWEIEKVVFDDGNDKLYTINESYDYFEINKENKGFRKKVTPQLNGTFLVNDTYENIKIQNIENKFFIVYETPYTKWKEEILSISKEKLVLKNEQKSEYHYKKAAPITILNDGKKIK
jgi:hypothetical protein